MYIMAIPEYGTIANAAIVKTYVNTDSPNHNNVFLIFRVQKSAKMPLAKTHAQNLLTGSSSSGT